MSSNRASSAESPWSFEDLVDFEYAIRLESYDSSEQIEKRDRQVLEGIPPDARDSLGNRDLLKRWLETVRESLFPDAWIPGEFAGSAIRLSSKIVFAIALLTGITMAAGFLSYEGSEPVNVSAFIGVFILLQLALAALSIVLILLLQWAKNAFDCFLGIRMLRPLAYHFAASLLRYAASRLESKQRSAVQDASGDLKSLWVIYRPLLQRKAFALLQSWAIAFNLGVIGTTLVIVLFSDRAFGWQTTLQVDANWLHRVVHLTSWPWSWFAGEGVGVPSLSEIEGSRIILKDGIRSLNSGDLVSWWPYLVLGTVVYGLLPRIAFYCWGLLSSRYCLSQLSFSHAEASRIAERIRSRDLGFCSNADRTQSDSGEPEGVLPGESANSGRFSGEAAVCLLATDYHGELPREDLVEALSQKLHLPADQLKTIPISAEDQMDPDSLSLELDFRDNEGLVIVFASWMPPIEEMKQLILAVRRNMKSERLLCVELLGPRDSEGGFEDPKPQEIAMWKSFVRRLGDPYCALNPAK